VVGVRSAKKKEANADQGEQRWSREGDMRQPSLVDPIGPQNYREAENRDAAEESGRKTYRKPRQQPAACIGRLHKVPS